MERFADVGDGEVELGAEVELGSGVRVARSRMLVVRLSTGSQEHVCHE